MSKNWFQSAAPNQSCLGAALQGELRETFIEKSEKARQPLSRVQLCALPSVMHNSAIPWMAAHQASLSAGFSRQEQWSGLPFPSPGDLSDPGIEPGSPALQADSLQSESPGKKPFIEQDTSKVRKLLIGYS